MAASVRSPPADTLGLVHRATPRCTYPGGCWPWPVRAEGDPGRPARQLRAARARVHRTVRQQELNEGDIIAIGHAAFRLAGGELTEYAGDGADGEPLAGMIVTRLERWLEPEGVFEVPGAGHVELANRDHGSLGALVAYVRFSSTRFDFAATCEGFGSS